MCALPSVWRVGIIGPLGSHAGACPDTPFVALLQSGVLVGVSVGVAVNLGVLVGVRVRVGVAVDVPVRVGVRVGVEVRVLV